MLAIYNIGIKIYYFLVYFVSFFNIKAKKWIEGRKTWKKKWSNQNINSTAWFHFASLGEFEQGKPLMETYKERFPSKKILITFFSPSGYEVRKNSPLGDYILYLPLDTAKNAQEFIEIFKPDIAFFNKYEFWYHYFKALNKNNIPLYITSAIFRPQQIFFKSYGSFNRDILSYVTHFFVQNQESLDLLTSINLSNASLSGDTRFDSVNNLTKKVKDLPFVYQFKNEQKILIAGSTWPEDEKILAKCMQEDNLGWKIIFAPHEIKPEKIKFIEDLFPKGWVVKHSEIDSQNIKDYKVLIIDNIGMLSSLYPYGEITYIGGGFGAGIHNTLEAATWAKPVIFGPKYHKFQEAKDLIAVGAGFSINNEEELLTIYKKLVENEIYRTESGNKAREYVKEHVGASEIIMNTLFE